MSRGVIAAVGRRIAPDRIAELRDDEIFVFGSNLAGMHAGGAARIACRCFGAVWGQGVGLQGQSYAIPTMQGGMGTIRPYVDEFIDFTRRHPHLKFFVTGTAAALRALRPKRAPRCLRWRWRTSGCWPVSGRC